jgi:hypothetical protein
MEKKPCRGRTGLSSASYGPRAGCRIQLVALRKQPVPGTITVCVLDPELYIKDERPSLLLQTRGVCKIFLLGNRAGESCVLQCSHDFLFVEIPGDRE